MCFVFVSAFAYVCLFVCLCVTVCVQCSADRVGDMTCLAMYYEGRRTVTVVELVSTELFFFFDCSGKP